MPCGGIGAGQLYVRGDGTLAQWWIDNTYYDTGYGHPGVINTPMGTYPIGYPNKANRPPSPVDQGFAISVKSPMAPCRGAPAESRRLRRYRLHRRIPDRHDPIRYKGRRDAARGDPGRGFLAVDSAEHSGFGQPGNHRALHRAEHVRSTGRGGSRRLAPELRLAGTRGRRGRASAEPSAATRGTCGSGHGPDSAGRPPAAGRRSSAWRRGAGRT